MNTPPDLATWRDEFLAGTGLTEDDLREGRWYDQGEDEAAKDRHRETIRYAEEHIPPRYASALPTDPGVCQWMAAVIRQAIADREVVLTVTTGPSLLLLGQTGTGKTWQSFGAVRGLAALGVRCRWRAITAPDLCARMRPSSGLGAEDEFRKFANARLLVLDDLGAMKASEWTEEIIFRLVNRRYERMAATLFTSNLAPGQLADALGDRVASRLTEMTGRAVLTGADRRYRG